MGPPYESRMSRRRIKDLKIDRHRAPDEAVLGRTGREANVVDKNGSLFSGIGARTR